VISNTPSVSVIIIFLNAAQFIDEAIKSVFDQTYDEWELLLVDDGSTDGSSEIAKRYASQRSDKVRYLTHAGGRNRGMSSSRNLGIEQARGHYLAFLDADDVWLPQKLEQQVALIEAHPEAALVYGPVQWWHDWTGDPQDVRRNFVDRLEAEPETLVAPPALLTSLLIREAPAATNSLVRRAVAEQVGGFETRFGGMYEDQAFFAKVCLASPVFVASECWYKWRRHPNSCCAEAVRGGRYLAARRKFLRWLEAHMLEQKVEDGEVWNALQMAQQRAHQSLRQRIRESAEPGLRLTRQLAKAAARHTLPARARRALRDWWRGERKGPAVGKVMLGDLRRLTPISRQWGFDRGQPVDRYYIERFLAAQATDICGRVLEIGNNAYTLRFGGDRVRQSDVLHAVEGNPAATYVADLSDAPQIPSGSFDCIILTQTLLVIYDVRAALGTLHRILKPGGVLLATVPGGAHQIAREDMELWGDYWRFTDLSARRLFEEVFPAANVTVETFGNVLAAISFLHGLAKEDLRQEELDYRDPDYQVTITLRAVKPGGAL
jgi:glycosyltransferase involved in cell wall biosynthesis/SAM-dependent methyltransferase